MKQLQLLCLTLLVFSCNTKAPEPKQVKLYLVWEYRFVNNSKPVAKEWKLSLNDKNGEFFQTTRNMSFSKTITYSVGSKISMGSYISDTDSITKSIWSNGILVKSNTTMGTDTMKYIVN